MTVKYHGVHGLKKPSGKKIKPLVDQLPSNNSELVPTALKMIENLKSVNVNQNPTMMNAVGASSLAAAQKAVAAIFANTVADDPCSLPREEQSEQQIGECACAVPVEQRTIQQAADCLYWTTLQDDLTANTVPDVPVVVSDADLELVIADDVDIQDVLDGGIF